MSNANLYASEIDQQQRQLADYRFIEAHGTAYYTGHSWNNRDGSMISVSSGPHATRQEADASLVDMLTSAKYDAPRWWQYWRWGERVPKCWLESAE